jgi:hypothetical protein
VYLLISSSAKLDCSSFSFNSFLVCWSSRRKVLRSRRHFLNSSSAFCFSCTLVFSSLWKLNFETKL